MLKILAADDESLFLKRICTTIDWEAIGCTICGTATDGLDALDKAISLKPDIALIDINMPYLNGLELVRLLADQLPELAVVIISGHSEFEYARQAMKLGVREYLLKPYNDEELLQIVQQIKDDLNRSATEKAMERRSQRTRIESDLNARFAAIKEIDEEEFRSNMAILGLRLDSSRYGVIAIDIDVDRDKQLDANELLLWKFIVLNVANDIIAIGDKRHYGWHGTENRIMIIAGLGQDAMSSELELLTQLERLRALIEQKFKFTITIGIGGFYDHLESVSVSYSEAMAALRNQLIVGKNRIIEYKSMEAQTSEIGFYPSEINDDLYIYLRQYDTERIVEKVEQVFQYIRESRFSIDNTYVICTGLVSICLSFIVQMGYKIEDVMGKDFDPLARVQAMDSLDQVEQWIVEVYRLTLEGCNQFKRTRPRMLAEEAKKHIELHYNDPELRVDKIAKMLFVSENYLMSAFKKRFGVTIVDQILSSRMLKARELIRSGSIKLSAVSFMVGYNDPGYFSKSFKKYYGLSPSEYENETRSK